MEKLKNKSDMLDKNKVLLGLSGGVDSTSAALLLKEKGLDVTGYYFDVTGENTEGRREAQQVADQLDIELICDDVSGIFKEKVINNFCSEYLHGRTPNPCVICNPNVKFRKLIETADRIGAFYIATGHYCRIFRDENTGACYVTRAVNEKKDQSYMLYRLQSRQLSRLVLPLGDKSKETIKQYARQRGFEKTAAQRESFGLCFTAGRSYKDYLIEHYPELKRLENGMVIDTCRKPIGTHQGYPFYTIGQWKGLETKEKKYVLDILPQTNTIVAGTKAECFKQSLVISELCVHQAELLERKESLVVKIRGKDEGTQGHISLLPPKEGSPQCAKVEFAQPVFAPMRGQDVVAYSQDETIVVGGRIV